MQKNRKDRSWRKEIISEGYRHRVCLDVLLKFLHLSEHCIDEYQEEFKPITEYKLTDFHKYIVSKIENDSFD